MARPAQPCGIGAKPETWGTSVCSGRYIALLYLWGHSGQAEVASTLMPSLHYIHPFAPLLAGDKAPTTHNVAVTVSIAVSSTTSDSALVAISMRARTGATLVFRRRTNARLPFQYQDMSGL